MLRQFELSEADREFLDATGLDWESVVDGADKLLFIHNHPLPPGYNVSTCTVALRIPPSYPDGQIDMAYYKPALHRTDQKPINNLSLVTIAGQPFQQWSRHRPPSNPWRPDVDCISTHLTFMTEWLKEEFRKR